MLTQPSLDFLEALQHLKYLKGIKLLIVDSDEDLRKGLRNLLSKTFEIHEARTGVEGLNKALTIRPSAIISNLLLSGMSGIDFCEAVKNCFCCGHIPFIILSDSSNEALFNYCHIGADAYIRTPIKIEVLVLLVINFIHYHEKFETRIKQNLLDKYALNSSRSSLNVVDEEFLKNVIRFIEANTAKFNLDANFICKQLAISRTFLYSKIKALTGKTVHELIKTLRLKRSAGILLEGKLSISQIAYEVGFNSHSYFDKCFIKEFGIGPKEYKKRETGV